MLTTNDRRQLAEKNISEDALNEQLACFVKGYSALEVKASATTQKGIKTISDKQIADYLQVWDSYLQSDKTVLKFVPASGAASRMFKHLFAFLKDNSQVPSTDFLKTFFDHIAHFAFYEALNRRCLENEGKDVASMIAEGRYKAVVENLLEGEKFFQTKNVGDGAQQQNVVGETLQGGMITDAGKQIWHGLGYGSLPKGLLLFHHYPDGARTALEEHFVEGALYAKNKAGEVNLHLTVSPEHLPLFEQLVAEKRSHYEQQYSVTYSISFSTQNPSTDTIAVDVHNQPFREADGSLLFRPGGHGALIGNLNHLDADVVFIKNIDNVVPDRLKETTVTYKKVLAGVLVDLQQKIFNYLQLIDSGEYTYEQVEEMIYFLQNDLCVKNPETKLLEDVELILYIKRKLMRPLRVCGMVLNDGEPGGGPFLAVNPDGTISPQIVERSQLDENDPETHALYKHGTHFNPVDIVCALKRPDGKKYNLLNHLDKNTGFISKKSKDGRELKALELPGLWNGSMSDWNTVFVEVPIETFNPVKTVNDLLRPQHQS